MSQQNWFDLRDKMGDQQARDFLVSKLEGLINTIKDPNTMPDIFGYSEEQLGTLPIYTLSITISDVWGG